MERPTLHVTLSAVVLLWGLGLGATGARPESEPVEPGGGGERDAAADDEPEPVFYLWDGGRIACVPELQHLEVATRYGVLRVPVEHLVRVRFSRRIEDETAGRVRELILDLASADFDVRERATDALLAIGPEALPQLREATESSDEQVKSRAVILCEELEASAKDAPGLALLKEIEPMEGASDEVVTRKFTIRGRVQRGSFRVESRYGPLDLDVGDLVGIHFQRGAELSERLTVDGRDMVPSMWQRTKLTVLSGRRLEVRASGQLHLSQYGIVAGPDGTSRYQSSAYQRLPTLALVGKIGEDGQPFLVGSKYKETAKSSGTLYLGIVPRRNYVAAGSYRVEVKTVK